MICKSQVKTYCCDDLSKIENYETAINDNTQTYDCHHRLETHNSDGNARDVIITHDELVSLGVYYDRPASELIFLTRKEHNKVHEKYVISRSTSSEALYKNSIHNTGELNGFYGKHHSNETKKMISESHKGKHYYNNGVIEVLRYECPEGFVPGGLTKGLGRKLSEEHKSKISKANKNRCFSEEHKRKLSESCKGRKSSSKGKHCYNNGIINIMANECPEGFVSGMLRFGKSRRS